MIEQFIDYLLNNPLEAIVAALGIVGINLPMIWSLIQNVKQNRALKNAYGLIDEYKEKLLSANAIINDKIDDYKGVVAKAKDDALNKVHQVVTDVSGQVNNSVHQMESFYHVLQSKIDILESEVKANVLKVQQKGQDQVHTE